MRHLRVRLALSDSNNKLSVLKAVDGSRPFQCEYDYVSKITKSPQSWCSLVTLIPLKYNMSGAAASAGASKFTSFMNHPAGTHFPMPIDILRLTKGVRAQNCVLLGPTHEVVFGGCWY